MSTSDTDIPVGDASTDEKPKLSLDVKVEEPSACQRHVTVTISPPDIDRYFRDAFDKFQPNAEVPGFRPGRAPRKLVESRFRDQVSDQVKGSLLMDSVTQVSEEQDFAAISEPNFDFEAIEMPEDGPLTFEFDIEVRPEFDVPDWKGIDLERPVHEYGDEEVDDHLKKLLGRYGQTVTKDGPIQAADTVTLQITTKHNGNVILEVENETVSIKPTLSFNDANIEGFDKLILGGSVGEKKTVEVTISADAENEALRGEKVEAEFEVKAIKRVELPELTPGFLDRIGGFEDEADLRGAVRGELERQHEYHQQQRIRQQITAFLIKDAKWELPPDLLKRQGRRELERAVLELRSAGFPDDSIRAYQNQLRQNSQDSTARALKEHFILERIAEDHEFDVEPEDFDAEVIRIAQQSQESPRRVRARLEKQGQMDALRNQIIERKVIDLITSEANFEDVPFKPEPDDTIAIDHAIGGHSEESDIPEAKYGADAAEELPGQTPTK
ncbi:MAG: trigger factor [Pirellulaceae bacterium]|nr:trigger factor [Pirellulaceae bacterium]